MCEIKLNIIVPLIFIVKNVVISNVQYDKNSYKYYRKISITIQNLK